MEELTEETLGQPARILTDLLSSLKICCDYAEQGCREVVELGVLKTHVASCGFCPVRCSNDECSMTINKRDKEIHENKVCEFRIVKCEYCGEEVQHLKYKTHSCATGKEINEIKLDLMEMKGQLNQIHSMQEEMMKQINGLTSEMKNAKQSVHDPCDIKSNFYSKKDIVVVGGFTDTPVASAERFNWIDRKWIPLHPMREPRSAATAVIFENQIIVSGGKTGHNGTDTMEVMNMNRKPERWLDFPAKLPFKCRGHKCVVYRNRLLVIGGLTNEGQASDGIYEVLLTPPYSSKLLTRMEQKRCYHGVALFNDKVLIFGGQGSKNISNNLKSVLMYDINQNKCTQLVPLPSALTCMSIVCWEDWAILMGGKNINGTIDSVIAYNYKTGKRKLLPSMNNERMGSTAVIKENVIVVIGGGDENEYFNSVECFSFFRNSWEDLPPMNEHRLYSTAI